MFWRRRISGLLILMISVMPLYAYHIIGGEMVYKRLTGNNFEIKLKIYRDCSSPDAAPYDNPLRIFIYTSSGYLYDTLVINFPGSDPIDADVSNPCIVNAPDLCVQEAIYIGNINLPPSPGGYDLVYQRCCRNSTIINLYDPVSTGATYTEHIPDPGSMVNSSPEFNNLPPILICGNYPFTFDHAATDPDGDVLEYSFFTPYDGGSFADPKPYPALAPPFPQVNFYPPYSEDYPIESAPAFTINPATGVLSGTPTAFGQFVVGIAVKEYRAGVLIGTHYRDFQFNITDCEPAIVAALPDEINECTGFTVHFENWSYGTTEFQWDFGVAGITSDVSTEETPTYVFPDTGTYEVMLIAFPGEMCADTTFTTVHIYPYLIPDMGFENTCSGSPVQFTDLSSTDFGSITSWQWNYGDGWGSTEENPVYSYDAPGNYMLILTVQNSVGCTAELYDTITIYHLPYADIGSVDACLGSVGTVVSNSVIFIGNEITDWQWEDPQGNMYSGESFNYYFDTAGIYPFSLTVTSNYGCVDSITENIIVPENVVALPISGDTICEGDSLQLFAGGGTYYSWLPAADVSDPSIADPFVSPVSTTDFAVIVSDDCSSDTAYVTVYVLPAPDMVAGPDTIVYSGNPVQMFASGADMYLWQPPDGLTDPLLPDPVATPDHTTQYIITGTNENGCSTIDTALVYLIPDCFHFNTVNAFTPNGDGINDRFRFITTGDDELVSLEIYNRWGQLIFRTNDLAAGWDGTDGNGKQQEIGSYIFKILTQCEGILQTLSGSVSLLR